MGKNKWNTTLAAYLSECNLYMFHMEENSARKKT